MFTAERPALVPYAGRFDGFHAVPASVAKTCLVWFDNNRYDSERLQTSGDFGTDIPVDMHSSERDAAITAVIEEANVAMVPARIAVGAGISDVELASAMTTAQQGGEQRLTPTQRTTAHRVLASGIVSDQAQVPLVVRPAQVTLVVVRNQHLLVLALLLEAGAYAFGRTSSRVSIEAGRKKVFPSGGDRLAGLGLDVMLHS